jgi:hypothetical protein
MTATPWQFTDARRVAVFFFDDQGRQHSALASSADVKSWIAAGNAIADPPALSLVAQAQAALVAGCAISSTLHPELSATYPIDPVSQGKLSSTASYVAINSRFPAGQTSWTLLDTARTPRVIPDVPTFLALVSAIADYVAHLDMILDGIGAAAALPVQPIAIP